MFSTLRTRFGIPGVISVIALVFAMFGGAYAASNSSGGGKATASAKAKQGPRGKTGKTGPAGPAGPAGPTGPAGPKGDNGAAGSNGTNGTNGADGKTVLSGTGVPSNGLGSNGDFYIDTEEEEIYGPKVAGAWGAPTSLKGAEGSAWTAGGTLPVGSTESGVYAMSFPSATTDSNGDTAPVTGVMQAAISFNIPLAAPLSAGNVHVVSIAEQSGNTVPAACDSNDDGVGSAAEPQADSGNLCLFQVVAANVAPLALVQNPDGVSGTGAGKTGAIFSQLATSSPGNSSGTWAVTG